MTTTVILQIVAGLGGLLTLWLKEYFSADNVAARKEEAAHEAVQEGRQDLVSGNVAAIESRIDSVCDGSSGSAAGLESAEDVERRISQL